MSDCRPWLKFYGKIPAQLVYPEITLYEALVLTCQRFPNAVAFDFFDTIMNYRHFLEAVDKFAAQLSAVGLKSGERLLIAMPTSPQGIIAFYAANKIGVVPAFVHPLSTSAEIENYMRASHARIALTLDAFYDRFQNIAADMLDILILARIPDYLSAYKSFGFWLTKGYKIRKVPVADKRVRWWKTLMSEALPLVPRAPTTTNDPAAILFSGGTTGNPKGILLSNRNFIAQSMQTAVWGNIHTGQSILAILPIFHGFGLGVCVNAALMNGATSILVPIFSAETVAELLRKKRPNFMVGVPTLYAALIRCPSLAKVDLSCLEATFSGADRLPRPLKEEFEKFVAEHGGHVKLLEGYGLTEAVTAIMAMPPDQYREGSIGIPFPDMLAKICRVESQEELPLGEEGEICLAGPDVMLGYLDDPEATSKTLVKHADGKIWLHTGDLGKMDADGFFYFTDRLKRMIKSSGYNVFPTQVEKVLYSHPLVAQACVAGVPDPMQVERVMAFIVLTDPKLAGPETENKLIDHCHSQLIKWSCPREIEFRRELPVTRIGKIDYKKLVAEHIASQSKDLKNDGAMA